VAAATFPSTPTNSGQEFLPAYMYLHNIN
jgi:hypothetical protein